MNALSEPARLDDPAAPSPTAETRAGPLARWGWMLFDVATQPFNTLILTFVFAPYFTSRALDNESAHAMMSAVGMGFMVDPAAAQNDAGGQAVWGLIVAVTGMLTALASPILGAIADVTGTRKPWIAGFSVLAVLGATGLWLAAPDAGVGALWLGALAFALAFFGFEFATVFNNAMMPGLVPRAELGRLSGNAWALGYVGGLATLVIVLAFMVADADTGLTLAGTAPIFGLDPAAGEGPRAAGPFTALWYAVFVVPLFLFVPDAPRRARVAGAVRRGLSELGTTIRTLPAQRSLFAYLGSSMLYRDGLNGVYTFGGVYAAGVLGWVDIRLGVFGIIAALVGAVGAWLGGKLDDALGPKTMIAWSIILLIIATVTTVSLTETEAFFMPVGGIVPDLTVQAPLLGTLRTPDLVFLGVGAVLGAAGGALQASSRTLLVDQADPERMTEAFGLYALSGKATSFLAPALVAGTTALFASQRLGIVPIIFLFAIGLALLPLVRQRVAS